MVVSNRYNTLPVDRGWAWAVAAGGFLAHSITGGSNTTNSVLFVDMLKKYEASITTASLMFMCSTLAFSISSLLTTTFILPRLDERRCLLLGGIMSSLLSMGASFAPNIGAFIAFIALKGSAHGLIFVPSITLIRYYFKKYRSRASMVPWCGGSMAGIIGPFIIRAIRKEFGLSGTYFILTALELHVCVAGLLLRPISAYRFIPDDADTLTNDTSTLTSAANHVTNNHEDDAAKEEKPASQYEDASELDHNVEEVKGLLLLSQDDTYKTDLVVEDKMVHRIDDVTDSTKDHGNMRRERHNSFFGSVHTLDSEIGTALEIMAENTPGSPQEKGLTRWQKLYQDSSLELWSFRWMLLATLPGTVNGYLLSYLPTISNFQGASLDEAALLVTILGAVDIPSRICVGYIADTNVLTPSKILVIAQICMGTACHLFRFTSSFQTLVPMIIFIGLFVGVRGPLISLMCIEIVGNQKMPQAYSIVFLLTTLTAASFNPILGAVVEETGSFVSVMHIIGSCFILCAILIGLTPLFSHLDIKQGRTQ